MIASVWPLPMPHALLVEDDSSSLTALAELVAAEGFTTSTAATLAEARRRAEEETPDVVLVDLKLPDGSGLELLKELEDGAAETILITGHASVDTAVEALRMGISDYLTKPLDVPRLKTILANVARTWELREEIGELRGELRKLGRFGSLVGASPAMQEVYDLIARVAPTRATVLITGESGTGKEMVAETVHRLSSRRKGPFLPLNCGAISPTLIESELFGHERGSFTGAARTHKGVFERASGGTLLLDEITEMPIELQAKLLRVLETSAFNRVGAERPLKVDVRIVAASNRDPESAVAEGQLRQDLLYRLSVFPIHLPPLRERRDDVRLLAEHFCGELNAQEGTGKAITPEAMERLAAHDWPGNVRELKNLVQRAFILADGEIGVEHLAPALAGGKGDENGGRLPVGLSIAEVERRLILATLEECGGEKKKTAEVLGISLKTLYNKLNAYHEADAAAAATAPGD
jgi:two-component system, NtrC family, response regulator HydG